MGNLFKKLIAGVMVTALLITSFILPTSAAEIDSENAEIGSGFYYPDGPYGIIDGKDDRVESYDPRVVNVDLPSGARGTGFLVAKNIIITCRHCVGSDTDMKNLKVRTIQNKSYNVSVIAKGKFGEDGNSDHSEDWAILKADTTVCIDYFDISTSVSEDDWLTTTGFPGDRPYQTTESGKHYVGIVDGMLVNTLDVFPGQSGSPVYKTIKDQDYAVAIFSVGGGPYFDNSIIDRGWTNPKVNCATMIDDNIYEKVAAYRNHFTIKYSANGGTGSMSDSIIAIGSGNNLKKNNFQKEGYAFKGWFANRHSDNKWLYERTSNGKTEYAWKTEGNYSDWKKSLYKNGEFVSATSSVNNDIVDMYAQWEKCKYTVKYRANGGTGSMNDTTVLYGSPTPLRKNTFKRENYVFLGWAATRIANGKSETLYNTGWHTEAEAKAAEAKGEKWNLDLYNDEVKIARSTNVNNAVVYMDAQWEHQEYTVRYYSNGGHGKMDDTKVLYGEYTPLRKNAFRKGTRYTFVGWTATRIINGKQETLYNTGWYTEEEAKGKDWELKIYKDEAPVACSTPVHKGIVTMTAQWKAN